jgi:hypothetical protein
MADDEATIFRGRGQSCAFVGKTPAATAAMLPAGHLPAYREGRRVWAMRKTTFLEHVERAEAEAAEAWAEK